METFFMLLDERKSCEIQELDGGCFKDNAVMIGGGHLNLAVSFWKMVVLRTVDTRT